MRVYHAKFLRAHVDLDAISVVSDAQIFCDFDPATLKKTWKVGCTIHLKSDNKPYCYSRPLSDNDEVRYDGLDTLFKMSDGRWVDDMEIIDFYQTQAAQNLQQQINLLVSVWKG